MVRRAVVVEWWGKCQALPPMADHDCKSLWGVAPQPRCDADPTLRLYDRAYEETTNLGAVAAEGLLPSPGVLSGTFSQVPTRLSVHEGGDAAAPGGRNAPLTHSLRSAFGSLGGCSHPSPPRLGRLAPRRPSIPSQTQALPHFIFGCATVRYRADVQKPGRASCHNT